jgi:hypothetical protein
MGVYALGILDVIEALATEHVCITCDGAGNEEHVQKTQAETPILLTCAWLKSHARAAPGKLNEAVELGRIKKIRRAKPTKFSAARRK